MTIYVGNIPFNLKEEDLQAVFEPYGAVSSVKVVRDRMTGRSKGFAFVEMADQNEGTTAVASVNGKEVMGRQLKVNEAKPRD